MTMSALTTAIALLVEDEAVAGLVADRIYPVVAMQGAPRPHLVVTLLSEEDAQMLDGAGGYPESRVSVECIADTATAADALGEAVKGALEDVTNQVVGEIDSSPSLAVVATVYKAGADITDAADDRSVFRRVLDFMVRWRNAA
jgi:hypothetical protein